MDGTDYFAVREAMRGALEVARSGGGPVSIECVAPRWYGHFEGDPQSYRTTEEIDALRANGDPLKLFRKAAMGRSSLTEADFDAIDRQVSERVETAMAAAREAPEPEVEELCTDVYEVYD